MDKSVFKIIRSSDDLEEENVYWLTKTPEERHTVQKLFKSFCHKISIHFIGIYLYGINNYLCRTSPVQTVAR